MDEVFEVIEDLVDRWRSGAISAHVAMSTLAMTVDRAVEGGEFSA